VFSWTSTDFWTRNISYLPYVPECFSSYGSGILLTDVTVGRTCANNQSFPHVFYVLCSQSADEDSHGKHVQEVVDGWKRITQNLCLVSCKNHRTVSGDVLKQSKERKDGIQHHAEGIETRDEKKDQHVTALDLVHLCIYIVYTDTHTHTLPFALWARQQLCLVQVEEQLMNQTERLTIHICWHSPAAGSRLALAGLPRPRPNARVSTWERHHGHTHGKPTHLRPHTCTAPWTDTAPRTDPCDNYPFERDLGIRTSEVAEVWPRRRERAESIWPHLTYT